MAQSNYEVMKTKIQAIFAQRDLKAAAREWQLPIEGEAAHARLVGRDYDIDLNTGAITSCVTDGAIHEADYNVAMTFFDMLTRPRAAALGIYDSLDAFTGLHGAGPTGGGIFDRSRDSFDGHEAALADACRALGGVPYGKADVGFIIPVFRDLSVVLQFWSGDDEFGPELKLLCDKNVLSFMTYETMMFMLCHLLGRLTELMNV